MRNRRSPGVFTIAFKAVVKLVGFILLPLVLLYRLSEATSLRRRNSEFAADVSDAYSALIRKYGGKVIQGRRERGSFDYVEASVEFADRTLYFVRGRGELTFSCSSGITFTFNADDVFRSAAICEKHWNELLDADYNQAQKWLKSDA
jgi:hypothetical protein